ncbi:MAG: Nif11 family protein [Synechococcaceae cyanobacterium]|nr:Nif11 family protein [Synechococcaceae cyanobacterium]
MSWSELERLVEEAEADGVIRRSLRRCRSRRELVLAARRLGYRITQSDLQRAWELHRQETARRPPAADPGRATS